MPSHASHDRASHPDVVARVLRRHARRREALLQILREVQAETGWLSRPVLAEVAAGVGLGIAVIEGVASFYRHLHLRPVGRVHLLFSDNVTDRHQGSRELVARLCLHLGVAPGEVTADGGASVGYTSCTGLGDQGPAALVNQHHVLTRLDAQRIDEIAACLHAGEPPACWPAHWQTVLPQIRRAGPLLGNAPLAGAALQALLQRGADATLAELAASGLRGRGGAGFDTARKWTLCRATAVAAGGTRIVVCNADEGEPGTFKDRVLLSEQADTVFEGMTVAARLLDAQRGFVYLRGEYRFLLESLQAVLARRRAAGLLGRAIAGVPGFDFDIDIHLGAGAYVCGEESALIESLEGKRGQPRIRPPYPVESGYLGQPTVVNNVETFCAAAHIALHGGTWWAGLGVPGSTGTQLHAVSGDVARLGVYEWPMGVRVAQILAEAGGVDAQAVQVGGPSGVCLACAAFDRRIAFDDVPSAGAFTVFGPGRDLFEVAHGYAEFFAHESCGFCTPCRVGTELVRRRFDKLAQGLGSPFDATELRTLEGLLQGTCHCGLGATATHPLRDTLAGFPRAYAQRTAMGPFAPGFDLDAELAPARSVTGRRDAGAHLARIG